MASAGSTNLNWGSVIFRGVVFFHPRTEGGTFFHPSTGGLHFFMPDQGPNVCDIFISKKCLNSHFSAFQGVLMHFIFQVENL